MIDEVGIKSDKVFEALMANTYPAILVQMTLYTLTLIRAEGVRPTITSAYREGDSGVHGLLRGTDFRSHLLSPDTLDSICEKVNGRFKYDPKRLDKVCLMFHDVGRGPHFHLQSHPNTVDVGE